MIAEAPAVPSSHEQRRLLCWWIRSEIDPDEAAATASFGHRWTRCRDCRKRGCPWCDVDRAETVKTGKVRSRDPRFVNMVLDRIDAFPPALVARASAGLASLPPAERIVISLTEGGGLSFDQAATALKCSRSTIVRVHQQGLEQWAAAVWPLEQEETP